jgi:hypothetical protein
MHGIPLAQSAGRREVCRRSREVGGGGSVDGGRGRWSVKRGDSKEPAMLFKNSTLQGIVSGKIDLAFRKWERRRVKPGSHLRTSAGVVVIDSVDKIDIRDISPADAIRAGFTSAEELIEYLKDYERPGDHYRVGLHYGGADPRIALRKLSDLSEEDIKDLKNRLERLDAANPHGPWTVQVLRLIDEKPAVLAGELAREIGRERLSFKASVRRLKELGLTESLEIGYRLSPRGKALLKHLKTSEV